MSGHWCFFCTIMTPKSLLGKSVSITAPCQRAVLFTTGWWTVCTHLTSVTTITGAPGCREEPEDTYFQEKLWVQFSMMCGMRYCSFIKETVSKQWSLKRMLFRDIQRNVNSSCHSPGEKHSSAYSNSIRFHWETNHRAQWCSKHGVRNSERGIKTVKTSMLRHWAETKLLFRWKVCFGFFVCGRYSHVGKYKGRTCHYTYFYCCTNA